MVMDTGIITMGELFLILIFSLMVIMATTDIMVTTVTTVTLVIMDTVAVIVAVVMGIMAVITADTMATTAATTATVAVTDPKSQKIMPSQNMRIYYLILIKNKYDFNPLIIS